MLGTSFRVPRIQWTANSIRVVGEGKTDGYSQSRGPRRFSFAERFGKGPVKAGRDGAKEKFGLHGGAEERTQNGRFPVPALDQDGERVAQQGERRRGRPSGRRLAGPSREWGRKTNLHPLHTPASFPEAPGSARKRPQAKERPGRHAEAVTLRPTFRCIQNLVNPL